MRPNKIKRTGVIITGHPTYVSAATHRFLRGLFLLMLALGSLVALSAQGQSNYPAPYYFNTLAANAYGGNGTGNQTISSHPFVIAVVLSSFPVSPFSSPLADPCCSGICPLSFRG